MSNAIAYRAFLFCKPFVAVTLSALIVVNALIFLAWLVRGHFDLSALTIGALQAWVVSLYMDQMKRTVRVSQR